MVDAHRQTDRVVPCSATIVVSGGGRGLGGRWAKSGPAYIRGAPASSASAGHRPGRGTGQEIGGIRG